MNYFNATWQLDKVFYSIGLEKIQESIENYKKDDKFIISYEIRLGNGRYQLREFLRRKGGYILFDIHEKSAYVDITIGFNGLQEDIYGKIIEVFARDLFKSKLKIEYSNNGITYFMRSEDIEMVTLYCTGSRLERNSNFRCNYLND